VPICMHDVARFQHAVHAVLCHEHRAAAVSSSLFFSCRRPKYEEVVAKLGIRGLKEVIA